MSGGNFNGPRARRGRIPSLRTADWPFSIKMGILPAIGIAAMFAIVAFAIAAFEQQTRLIDAVVTQDMDIVVRLSASATRLQRVDAGLYRMLALQAAALEAAHSANRPVAADVADLLAALDGVLSELATYRDTLPMGEKRRRVGGVIEALNTYRGAVEVVGSMLELDFASAVAFVRPFDGNTRSVLAALGDLVESASSEAAARARLSTDSAQRARRGFTAGAGMVAVLVAAIAFFITRSMVRSVESIAAATVLVARGERSVRIDQFARRDELGAIVESLKSFQDNVARVAFLAHHDALTGLPNRTLFHERLQSALVQLDRGHEFAVLCLDLDRFKAVNDTLGHPVGDALLREVGDRVTACVREGDTVSRLGGDEFAVIQLAIHGSQDAATVAERILRALAEEFDLEGGRVTIGCSIGIALAPADGSFASKLLKNADTALYRAKSEGRNGFRFFEQEMDAQLQRRRELEVAMRRAIAEQEFELHYQPLINVATMRVSGFEALMRWRSAEGGMISPAEFIPIAEETGLIQSLGEWALMQACSDAVQWPDPVKIAVNLSSVQFNDSRLLQIVLGALETSGLPPSRLELEITESILLHRSASTIEVLRLLRHRGVRISMDDFGTGYSSLSYLSSFPFDKIKIDQSFVRNLDNNDSSVAIVRAITGLSRSLGVTTTAEGVETREQFERLVAEGCTEVQGYLFGRPTPVGEVFAVLANYGLNVDEMARRRALL